MSGGPQMSGGPATPLTTNGGGRGPTTGRGLAVPRATQIEWHETRLVTPAAITGSDNAPTAEQQLRTQLGMKDDDTRPTLLYFHHTHAGNEPEGTEATPESKAGKNSRKQCAKLDDETVARWSRLYRFVEVDATASESPLIARFGGATDKPCFAVLDNDLSVVARANSFSSARKFVSFLEKTLQGDFETHWTTVEETLESQVEAIAEAERLVDDEKYEAATKLLFDVVVSDVRIGEHWDAAVARYWVVKGKASGS